ncbi:MAG: ferrous iron transport protein A [Pirellulales bacterium]|nr:ferrous iron transport protein A [Pirellulales bacterium]
MTTLDQLRPGQSATIVRVDGNDGVSVRLREMGFVSGQGVQFLRHAPLGDPIKCSVQGARVAVRCGEARRVFVEPVR